MAENYQAQAASILGGGGMSDGRFWNFSNQEAEDFRPVIEGTLFKVSFSQERQYDAAQRKFTGPAFWPDGNPKVMIRLHIKDLDGTDWLHEVKPKSHCLVEDWLPASPNGNIEGLLGQHIKVEAQQPIVVNGQVIQFGSGNRRHFTVTVMGPGLCPSEGVDYDSLGKLQSKPQPQAQQQPRVPAGVAGYQQQYAQQQATQVPQSRMMQHAYQVAQQYGYTAPQQQPQQPVAAAPAQQQQPPVDLYDDSIPF